jgi:hypothetical protein
LSSNQGHLRERFGDEAIVRTGGGGPSPCRGSGRASAVGLTLASWRSWAHQPRGRRWQIFDEQTASCRAVEVVVDGCRALPLLGFERLLRLTLETSISQFRGRVTKSISQRFCLVWLEEDTGLDDLPISTLVRRSDLDPDSELRDRVILLDLGRRVALQSDIGVIVGNFDALESGRWAGRRAPRRACRRWPTACWAATGSCWR